MQTTDRLAIVVVRNVIMVVTWFVTHQLNGFGKLLNLLESLGVWRVTVTTSQGFHEDAHMCLG